MIGAAAAAAADYSSEAFVAVVTEAMIEWTIFLLNLVLVPPKQRHNFSRIFLDPVIVQPVLLLLLLLLVLLRICQFEFAVA